MTLRNSLIYSRESGFSNALGVATGDLTHITFWLIGIGVIISKSIWLFNLLKWMGAIYLIYIGIKSLQARKQQNSSVERNNLPKLKFLEVFRHGFLTCLLNPKVTLFLLALFTQIIRPETPLVIQIIYGMTIVGIELTWLGIVAAVISQPVVRCRFLSFSQWFERIMGATLIFFGLRLALAKASHS